LSNAKSAETDWVTLTACFAPTTLSRALKAVLR